MAEQARRGGRKPELTPDPIVEALVPDPNQGPVNATVLQGYLGRGATPGTWRVYFTQTLDSYVEVNESDILHTRQLPDDQGKLVWVNRSAALQHVQVQSQQVQAEFLGGAITAAHLGAASTTPVAPVPAGPLQPVSLTTICATGPAVCLHSAVIVCRPSIFTICHSVQTLCLSHQILCRSSQIPCASLSLQCQSITTLCPTQPLQCQPSLAIPCQSFQGCPSFGVCPSFACGGGIGGGDPIAG